MRTHTLRKWTPSLVLLFACQHAEPPASGPSCFVLEREPNEPINPLLPETVYTCFDSPDACTRAHASRPASPACAQVGTPHWTCSATLGNANDPMSGVASCYPTAAICEASRVRPFGADVKTTECSAASHVWCAVGDGSLQCYADEAACKQADELSHAVLHRAHRACVAR